MLVAAMTLAASLMLAPRAAFRRRPVRHVPVRRRPEAAGGGRPRRKPISSPIPSANNQPEPQPARRRASPEAPDLRSACEAATKYFPPTSRGNASPAQSARRSAPPPPPRCFTAAHIDGAAANTGERYADSENAFAYRKALRADCTCNGRNPSGLAPVVFLMLDTSLRSGDVIATGLVAYTGVRLGAEPGRGVHAGRELSGPHRGCPCAARRDEAGAGQRRNGPRDPDAGSQPRDP